MAISEKAVEFLGNSLATGKSVPGQSLTNDPKQPYKWEQPPEFVNSKEASLYSSYKYLPSHNVPPWTLKSSVLQSRVIVSDV